MRGITCITGPPLIKTNWSLTFSFTDDDDDYEEEEEGNEDLGFFNVSDFVDKEDGGVSETVEENIDKELGFSFAVNKNEQEEQEEEEEDPEEFERKSKQLQEIFSCLPPVLIKRILHRDDVKGNIEKASTKLQEFQDMENPADLFKNPAEGKPLITKPEGKFENPQTHGPIKQAWVAVDKSSGGPEQESNRGKKKRRKPRKKNQTQGQHGDAERQGERRNSFDSDKSDQNEGSQACRGNNTRQRGMTRGGPQRGPRGGFFQDPNKTQVSRDDQFYAPQGQWSGHQNAFPPQRGRGNQRGQRGGFRPNPIAGHRDNSLYGSQEWRSGDGGNFQPELGRGGQSGRGRLPKPKPKPKGKGRGGGRGGNFQEQHQVPGDFQESDQFSDAKDYFKDGFRQDPVAGYRDNSLYGSQEWRFGDGGNFQPEMGRGGQSGRGRQPKPKPKPKGIGRRGGGRGGDFQEQHQIPGDFQESDQFPDAKDYSQFMPRKLNQQGGKGRDSQENQVHPVSLRELVSSKTPAPRPADQSQFERNTILIRGLSEKTSPDGLVNFIEAKSGGEEVKDVQMLKNGKALVTMADEIKGTYLSTEFITWLVNLSHQNSIARACLIFLLSTLMTSENVSLEKKFSIGLKML